MVKAPPEAGPERARARELYAMAMEMEKDSNYEAAMDYYRRSLALCEDETVKAAYFNLMTAIGPQ